MKTRAADARGKRPRGTSSQRGLTLVELMIAIVLGMLVLLVATHLLLSAKAAYVAEDQATLVDETGRYALAVVARAIRQAGYQPHGTEDTPQVSADLAPAVAGMDGMTLKKSSPALASATGSGAVNGSDILALRFYGDEAGAPLLNCAGLPAPAASAIDDPEQAGGWSIFFVAKDSGGEPELRCKYQTQSGWSADAIARGVESFQVLYGLDTGGDGTPDRFVNADGVDALDAGLTLHGENAVARLEDLRRRSYWKKVRAVRVALLVRGSAPARDDALAAVHDLFGPVYGRAHAADKGTRIAEPDLSAKVRNRIRRVYTLTVRLRNDPAGGTT